MFLQNNKEMTAQYWQCVDEHFMVETVEELCSNLLHGAQEVLALSGSLVERIVDFLDIKIGAMYRVLVSASPGAEKIEAKRVFVAEIFCDFYQKMDRLLGELLRSEGIHRGDAAQMFLAAAVGISQMSDGDETAYRSRLGLIVETLVAGL
jgi:hypothetical protein